MIFWIIGFVWLLIGLIMMVGYWRRNQARAESTPIIFSFVTLIFGPVVLMMAIVSATIEMLKR